MSLAGSVIHSEPASRVALRTALEEVLPRSAFAVVDDTLDEIELGGRGLAVWAAAIVAGWSATRGTRALVVRLNVAYGSVGRRSSVRRGMGIWEDFEAVERHPDRVSGAWVFRGTRVPVAALFENLRDGASIEQFLAWFPGVERSQVEAVLDTEAAAARSGR